MYGLNNYPLWAETNMPIYPPITWEEKGKRQMSDIAFMSVLTRQRIYENG